MFTKFYLISSLLIGNSAALAMDGGFIYFIDSDEENSKSQPMRSNSIASVMSENNLTDSGSGLTTSDSGGSGSDSDGGMRRQKSLKTEYPSPWYKDSVSFNGSPRREPKTSREQWSSEKRKMRLNALADDLIEETEKKFGKKRVKSFEITGGGITTTHTATSYDNLNVYEHSNKKSKFLAPKDQPKIDGFTARNVDESQKRSSFPAASQKSVKSNGKGSRKSFPPASAGQKKIDFFL